MAIDRPTGAHSFLAVFEDPHAARKARHVLLDAGVPADRVVIAAADDEVDSLRAEMREEVEKGWFIAGFGYATTKEGARGFLVTLVVGCAIALVIGVPLAFIDFGFGFWTRLLIVEGILLFLAAVTALVIGPGMATARPEVPLAAERGTTLRVDDASDGVRQVLIDLQPIRVDELDADHQPVGTVMTEADGGESTSIAAEAGRGVRDVVRNTKGDDFHAPPGTPTQR